MSISVSFKGPRADLVLSRPEVHNAIDLDGFHALGAAAAEIAANAEARVLVVRGEGPSFCSGIDTTTLGGAMGEPKDLVVRAQSGYRGLAGLTIPTIAAVHGHCYGAGLQLALACDL